MSAIKEFQNIMIKKGYDFYLVPTADYHNSEYISDYFKVRAFLSDFTGSAGTLLITQKNAYLWVDGRYFIQAAKQIEGTSITLMKMGTPNTPTLLEFLRENVKANMKLVFDGKLVNTMLAREIKENIDRNAIIKTNDDTIDEIWEERPKMPFSLLYMLDTFYTGKTYKEKLDEVLKKLAEKNVDTFILSALEDQAWLFNLRANDVSHTPVFLAFTVITNNNVTLFIDQRKLDIKVSKYLEENEVNIKNYNEIYDYVRNFKNKKILINPNRVNYQIYLEIENSNNIIKFDDDPTLLLKAVKNEQEIKNIKEAHIKDGLAVFRFMRYLKKNYEKKVDLSELGLSNTIYDYRSKTEGFIDISFDTICAYNEHAAMMHYNATADSSSKIDGPGVLLIDSGGHYFEGTTDITRTYSLGKVSDKIKTHYTTVLKSVINLAMVTFLKGCTGYSLDILARAPIWNLLIDYKCGTGHGVGNLLAVHEGPNSFRWQIDPKNIESRILVPGMITTDEPGIYLEGKYGIRIENEMLCVEKETNTFGTFYGFETITYAPIDLEPVKVTMLTKEEKEWLNNYHKVVYDNLSPYLDEEELKDLAKYTKKI